MKLKFVRKYMRLAKQVGEDCNSCHSRKIGSVVVRVYDEGSERESSKLLGTGYNSPPRNTPHCDAREYLRDVFWPQLTDAEKAKAAKAAEATGDDSAVCELVCDKYAETKVCPRKIIGAPSGQRLECCSCVHSETNAIVNAGDDLHGAIICCWCGVPCIECAKLIINSGIKRVYHIDWGADYSFGSRWLFKKAGVEVIGHPPEYYLEEE